MWIITGKTGISNLVKLGYHSCKYYFSMVIDSKKCQVFFLPRGVDLEQVKIGETAAIKGFGAEVRARVVSFVNKLEG